MSVDLEIPLGWSKAALGNVATEYSVRVDNPAESKYERFVGSNHISRFELTVSDWGSTSEVTSAMKVFQPGDYLLVRRSLYASDFRERAARASFEGVCSGDILTIREKGNVLAPGFLSAVLNTPEIWAHIVARATGSITRRIKWRQLQEYEFALPPLGEQQRIAGGVQAAESTSNRMSRLLQATASLLQADLVDKLDHGPDPLRTEPKLPPTWKFVPLGELISVRHGYAFDGKHFTDEVTPDPVLLTPGNFSDFGDLLFPKGKTKRFSGEVPESFWLKSGDLVVLMTDLTPTAFLLGVPGVVSNETGPILQNQRIGLIVNEFPELVSHEFLFYSFLGKQLRRVIRALSAGSTVHHTSPRDICSLSIPLPPMAEQQRLCQGWRALSDARRNVEARAREFRTVGRQLLLASMHGGDS